MLARRRGLITGPKVRTRASTIVKMDTTNNNSSDSDSDNCELLTVEDTTLVTSTQPEAEQKRKEGLENTPPTGNKTPHNSPPD